METSMTIAEISTLIQNMATINLGYLTLCVSIILFIGGLSGGFFYLFNFRPLQKSLENQQGELSKLTEIVNLKLDEINKNFESLKKEQQIELNYSLGSMTKKVNELRNQLLDESKVSKKRIVEFTEKANKATKNLTNQLHHSELDSLWQKHYMWEGMGVPGNTITTLIEYVEKAVEYKITYLMELCLSAISDTLDDLQKTNYNEDDNLEIRDQLFKALDKVQGHESEIRKIKDKAEQVLNPQLPNKIKE